MAMAPRSQKNPAMAIAMTIIFAASFAAYTPVISAVRLAKNSPEDYVDLHNAARAVAGAGPVSWDGEAARHAAMRAAAGCTRSTPVQSIRTTMAAGAGRGGYGENVFRGTPGTMAWAAADAAVRAWTAPAAAEFAQVVWPGSDRIGCAHAVCAGERGVVVVSCSYKPAVKEELRGSSFPGYCRYNISRCMDCPIC